MIQYDENLKYALVVIDIASRCKDAEALEKFREPLERFIHLNGQKHDG